MKFKLHQIVMSHELANRVNQGEVVPEFTSYQMAMFGNFGKVDQSHYEHVSDIDANDLEDVFHIGNAGPESKITRHKQMHSVSVGDIIEDESGERFFVAGEGFKNVKEVDESYDKMAELLEEESSNSPR